MHDSDARTDRMAVYIEQVLFRALQWHRAAKIKTISNAHQHMFRLLSLLTVGYYFYLLIDSGIK